MKKITMKKQTKTVEITEVRRTTPKFIKMTLSFMGSFLIMVGFILGIYWYGKQFYQTINGIFRDPVITSRFISPHMTTQYYDPLDLIEAVKKQDSNVVFLDIRSADEYKKAHIKYAVSVPFYAFENNIIKYTDVQTTLKQITIDKSKFIVVYGPSTSFQQQQEVVSQLKKNGYTAQLLAVGWNELRHFQNIWVLEGLWGKIDITIFIDEISD
jgi:rhodanese-related sulfurtransferase